VDNVTHTLAGLLAGEAAARLRAPRGGGEPAAGFRAAAWLAGAVAANLPDIDVVAPLLGADRLQALLHHRGYTHTVVAALAGAALVWAGTLALWRRRARRGAVAAPGAADRRWLLGAAVFAALGCHLALDWTNDYGVHVWWPASPAWSYGDSAFIIEPWLWVAAAPALAVAAPRRAAGAVLWVVLALAVALAWGVGLVGRGAAVGVTLGALTSAWAAWRVGPGRRAALAVGLWAAAELAFAGGTARARGAVARAVAAAAPGARLVDVVSTPAPGNPLCARVLTVETEGARYRVSSAWASAAPGLVPAARCAVPERLVGTPTAAFARSARAGGAAVVWRGVWERPAAELRALGAGNCAAAAVLRFARVPVWWDAGPDSLVVGDARYDREPGLGFAEFAVARRPAACPRGVPGWRPPRADVLAGR
jgi:inner membrane protein